jgi:hypothetical protein
LIFSVKLCASMCNSVSVLNYSYTEQHRVSTEGDRETKQKERLSIFDSLSFFTLEYLFFPEALSSSSEF